MSQDTDSQTPVSAPEPEEPKKSWKRFFTFKKAVDEPGAHENLQTNYAKPAQTTPPHLATPLAGEEPSANEKSSANKEPSANGKSSADKEPSANGKPSADKALSVHKAPSDPKGSAEAPQIGQQTPISNQAKADTGAEADKKFSFGSLFSSKQKPDSPLHAETKATGDTQTLSDPQVHIQGQPSAEMGRVNTGQLAQSASSSPDRELSEHKAESAILGASAKSGVGSVSPDSDTAKTPGREDDNKESEQGQSTWSRWRSGLSRTRHQIGDAFTLLFEGHAELDDELEEEFETLLLTSDVGLETTTTIISEYRKRLQKIQKGKVNLTDELKQYLADFIRPHSQTLNLEKGSPAVLMMVGVNGVGKTTTVGKLAKHMQGQGKRVMLAAGDTFRAAAAEQLQVWGERNAVPVVAQASGADSASVVYDALSSAKARGFDLLIADTAGRLHNKSNLMDELTKVVRVIRKIDPSGPHETLLVLDAATGQNALSQAREFCKAVPVTGLVLTKLDGTAKGGVLFTLVHQLQLPIKYIGLGEGIDDLAPFDPDKFVDALFASSSS